MSEVVNKPGVVEAMPILAKNVGVWEGWYRYYDAKTGELIDQHRSRLLCRLFTDEDGVDRYHQTNYYFWEDGRTDIRDFPAFYKDGRIWWDNDLIKGWCAQMQPDDNDLSTCLFWQRTNEPGLSLYEMIQNNPEFTNRARTWQWLRDGVCYQRTLIDEVCVSKDWQSWTDNSAPNN